MNIEIVSKPLELSVYGFSGVALTGDYAGTAFKLMDKMWQVVKANGLANEGKNIWIYEQGNAVFAGVGLTVIPKSDIVIEHKKLSLPKYAYYKHIGPYSVLKQVGQSMRSAIAEKGLEVTLPYLEIYGHWTQDETKLETELLMCVK